MFMSVDKTLSLKLDKMIYIFSGWYFTIRCIFEKELEVFKEVKYPRLKQQTTCLCTILLLYILKSKQYFG